jgi:hypothetical protein
MGILQDIRNEVNAAAQSSGLKGWQAFAYWFLEDEEDLSPELALTVVKDGPNDGGEDAVYYDEIEDCLKIYQFKYSEHTNYAKKGASDLQRALLLEHEKGDLQQAKLVKLYLVTLVNDHEALQARVSNLKRIAAEWLQDHGYPIAVEVELYDQRRFVSTYERIIGIDLQAEFNSPPIVDNGVILGLVNAGQLAQYRNKDELLAFNIRKFLAARKGSVGDKMSKTLGEDLGQFWMWNNGIACICTAYSVVNSGTPGRTVFSFRDFSVVNGAQTINTIGKFLDSNRAVTKPVWVVAKIVKLGKNDRDKAIALTTTSNTQTPTSNKDIRAVDTIHKTLQRWISEHSTYTYVYRRGDKPKRGSLIISMKELAQAYVSYAMDRPDVAFANVGQIFNSDEYFGPVFHGTGDAVEDDASVLQERGRPEEINAFVASRIVPFRVLVAARSHIGLQVSSGTDSDDPKWRSLAYQIVWFYGALSREFRVSATQLAPKLDRLLEETLPGVYATMRDYCVAKDDQISIPRDLKTGTLTEMLKSSQFREQSRVKPAVRGMKDIHG